MGATQATPQVSDNPFDVPLNSEIQESKQRQATAQKAQPDDYNPFDEPLASEVAEQKHAQAMNAGEITNDVGNTVIVPKPGESFGDTVKRATARWKSLTPEQQQTEITRESQPKDIARKSAETLGAAAGIGVAVPALLALPGELSELAIKHLAGNVLPGLEEEAAKAKLAQMAPRALQIVKEWALPVSSIGGLLKILSMGKK